MTGVQAELRPRKRKTADDSSSAVVVKDTRFERCDPIGTLKAGLHTVRHHTPGWLKEDLIAAGKLEDNEEAIHAKIWADYNAQQIHIRAQKDILGEDFNPLLTIPKRDNEGRFVFTKTIDVPKNRLRLTYLLHAYNVDVSTFKRLRLRGGIALPKQVPHNKGLSVLDNPEFAATIYTPRYFYIKKEIRNWSRDNPQASATRKAERRKWLSKNWDLKKEQDPNFGKAYEKKCRDHEVRQKGAKEELLAPLKQNGRRSFSALGKAMNDWCSISTIKKFFKMQPDFQYYSQNVRPLLSEGNRLNVLWTMRYVPST